MSKAAKALNPADPTKVDRTWQIRIAVEIPGLTTLKSDGVTKRRKDRLGKGSFRRVLLSVSSMATCPVYYYL